jgi:hypothetical protein
MSSNTNWDPIRVNRIHPRLGPLLHSLQEHDCYIAGGYARWACSPRDDSPLPEDIDIICPSERKLRALETKLSADGANKGRETEFAITFRIYPARDLQLLKRFRGETIEECLDQVDFSVCRVAIIGMDSAVADRRFLGDEQQGKLTVVNLNTPTMPENAVFRLMRYARKGYDFTQEDVMKVINYVRSAEEITGELVEQPSSFDLFGS